MPEDPPHTESSEAPGSPTEAPEAPASPEAPIEDYDAATDPDDERSVLVLRVNPLDVILTVGLLTTLVVLLTLTTWPTRAYSFLSDVCNESQETCEPVPFGVNYYIYPVVWGGIGVGVTAAVLGPFVSLLKGWRMYYWPILAAAVVMLSSLAGYALTTFSLRFWH